MTCHFSGTTGERWRHGKQRLKRWVLRRLRKMASDGADVTCCGRLFQIRGPATGKARSPTVDSRVRRTISDDVEAERAADDIELRCLLAARVRRRGTAVLHLADICKQVTGMQPFRAFDRVLLPQKIHDVISDGSSVIKQTHAHIHKKKTNTNTNKIYRARLTKCPGALTNVKTRDERDEFLKDF